MSNPLRELRALGQSVWYDHISRELLRSGELNRMIEHDGVSGLLAAMRGDHVIGRRR